MTRLTRKNSNIDKAEIGLDPTKVAKTTKLVESTSTISNQLDDVSNLSKLQKGFSLIVVLGD